MSSVAEVIEQPTLLDRLKTYRPEHGRYLRLSVFLALVLMWCYGSFRLSETLADIRYTWARWLRTDLISEIPLFETPLKWSALVAFFVFIFGVVGLQYFLNTPKIAETLIETEAELKKVTWPTTRETIGASTVVLVTVMILFGLLGVYDMILGNVTSFIFGLTH